MIRQSDPKNARLIAVVAATVISIACGTNYAYSAWAPQFAQRLKLSSTQSNLIGTAGNLGMYASGIPTGMMVDSKGPRWGVALGAALFACGYYPIAKAYEAGPNSFSVPVLCLFSFFTGAGSASAFTGALKASALNYPESRGTATAFPLSAFGLSACFFSTISALAFADNTAAFLYLLASGTVLLPVISFFFLRVLPSNTSLHLPQNERQPLRRTHSDSHRLSHESGAPHDVPKFSSTSIAIKDDEDVLGDGDEASSLLSKASSSGPNLDSLKDPDSYDMVHESSHLDIRGFALLPHAEFWQLFSMLGLLTGIGLMTINNIGNDAQALWYHHDPRTPPSFITKRQQIHVSILSVGSFAGRLASGIGSDILVSRFNRSRFWCLFVSAFVFAVVQLLATQISSPHLIFLLSSLTGVAYGILFGVFPSLVAHAFGVNGMSQNWGTMTLAPVISGNIFNLLYGKIYDAHSIRGEHGDLQCLEGLACYRAAYWVTFLAALTGIAVCGWSIRHENMVHRGKTREKRRPGHEREA